MDIKPLSPRDGYRLWAPTYAAETAISYLEDRLVARMTPPLAGLRLLDAGCGTGRRLRGCAAASAVGVDLSPEMLEAGIGRDLREPALRTMTGDILSLPLPDAGFDVVWCRLVIGHVRDCAGGYRELARVAAPGALVVVTDFHPAAHAAGHRRSFRAGGVVHELEHHVHGLDVQTAAARDAGLHLVETAEAVIGPDVRPFYETGGRADLYEAHLGLPVVLGLALRRET